MRKWTTYLGNGDQEVGQELVLSLEVGVRRDRTPVGLSKQGIGATCVSVSNDAASHTCKVVNVHVRLTSQGLADRRAATGGGSTSTLLVPSSRQLLVDGGECLGARLQRVVDHRFKWRHLHVLVVVDLVEDVKGDNALALG